MPRTRYIEGDGSIRRARELQRQSTPAEDALWAVVRNGGINGLKFRRQQRFGPFYADLICHAAKLVIEIDGETHAGKEAEDAARAAFMLNEGYATIGFTNADVLTNMDGVHHVIRAHLGTHPHPPTRLRRAGPSLSPEGERGL